MNRILHLLALVLLPCAASAQTVSRIDIRGDGLVGALFRPAATHRLPAVLVLGGSEGGRGPDDTAAELAAHGFVTLSLGYFGADSLPTELDQIPIEYFERAIAVLASKSFVKSNHIAILGTSKGAEAALLIAAHDHRVRAVAAYAPSSVVWSCICATPAHSSWSHRGVDIASVPPGRDPQYKPTAGSAITPVRNYLYRLAHADSSGAYRIRVENVRGPLMLIAGADDQLWPSELMARENLERRARARRRYNDVVLIYPGAGHLISPSTAAGTSTKIAGGRIETGGTPAANDAARADAWPKVVAFLTRSANSHASASAIERARY